MSSAHSVPPPFRPEEPRRTRRSRLHDATTRPVTPLRPPPSGWDAARRRLVGLARVVAGGLVVLAVVVVVAPLVLGGPGPGARTVVGHLVAAAVAVGATAVAAHRRTPVPAACAAAALVPVALAVLLGVVWWS